MSDEPTDGIKKHPWEIFPEDDSSSDVSRKRKPTEKRMIAKERFKAIIGKIKFQIKSHRVVFLVAVISVVILAGVGISAFLAPRENPSESGNSVSESESGDNAAENEEEVADSSTAFYDGFTVENARVATNAFKYASLVVKDIALEGVDQKNPNTLKIEDNMNIYIESLNSDYEKIYFRLYTIYLLSVYGDTDRAEYLLEAFENEKPELDKNQRYMYLMAYEEYYYRIDDKEKYEEYKNLIKDDPEFIEDSYVFENHATGEVIDDRESINRNKEILDKLNSNGGN